MQIQYIGAKPKKEDNVTASGVVWEGEGDVQDVPDNFAHKLLKHRDVWRKPPVLPPAVIAMAQTPALSPVAVVAEVTAPAPATEQKPEQTEGDKAEPKFVLVANESDHIVLDTMDDEALRNFAETHQLKVDGRIKGDKLRQAIYEAATAGKE